jgi:hypothetical protein
MESTCEDIDGDYICKCKFNHKGNGKDTHGCYQYIFPPYAIAAVGEFHYIAHSSINLLN